VPSFDAIGDRQISERWDDVRTNWAPIATSDLEALREAVPKPKRRGTH